MNVASILFFFTLSHEASGLGSAAKWIRASKPSNLPFISLLLDKSTCTDSKSCVCRVNEIILYYIDNPFLNTLPIVPSAPVIPIFIFSLSEIIHKVIFSKLKLTKDI